MVVTFVQNGHVIEVNRQLTKLSLIVDDNLCDVLNGPINAQLRSGHLRSEIKNHDGSTSAVEVVLKMTGLADDLILYLDGKPVETKKIL